MADVFRSPQYWRDCVEEDLGSAKRGDWMSYRDEALALVRNEVEGEAGYKLASYPRKRQYFAGKLFFGSMLPKVSGGEYRRGHRPDVQIRHRLGIPPPEGDE